MSSQTTDRLDLSTDYALNEDQIREYQRDGHILLKHVATSEEIGEYRPAIVAAADRYNSETRPLEERDSYGKAFLQIMNLWEKDETVRRFTLAHRFAKIAADLLGVPNVRLYHDQALFKEPGGGPTPWHQDQHYWPLDTDKTITLWMPLVNIPAEIGSMTFGTGSQKFGYLGDLPISDKSQSEIQNFISERGITTTSYGAMQAGHATFHAGWTLHSAPGNPTPNMREVMTVIYYADGTLVKEPANHHQESDLKNWLSGISPGELAASPRNPLL